MQECPTGLKVFSKQLSQQAKLAWIWTWRSSILSRLSESKLHSTFVMGLLKNAKYQKYEY